MRHRATSEKRESRHHSISSVACTMSESGIVMPRAFAALRGLGDTAANTGVALAADVSPMLLALAREVIERSRLLTGEHEKRCDRPPMCRRAATLVRWVECAMFEPAGVIDAAS